MRKRIYIIGAICVALIGIWAIHASHGSKSTDQFEFAEVERGNIENVISGTGTISAVGTVEVGTQVSGTIEELYVDFNDDVSKGQILAVLDTTMLAASVRDARAGVLRSKAQYELALDEYTRDEELFEKSYITEVQYLSSKTDMQTAQASLISAEAALVRAESNYGYAVIRSPIDGKVITRNVEPGQTVAASFSTPTLFLIAEDLSEMEILGLVDESDIGQISEGQRVRFTVEAYWDETFEGSVRQIRLEPETISNVVTYTVVIDVDNTEGLLYPGMTATIDFITEQVEDALLVPNNALSITPTKAMIEELHKERKGKRPARNPSESGDEERHMTAPTVFMNPGRSEKTEGNEFGALWYLDESGKLGLVPVQKGLTDGSKTAVTMLKPPPRHLDSQTSDDMKDPPFPKIELAEGLKIIAGIQSKNDDSEKNEEKSFNGGRPPGGFGPRF